MTMTSSFSMKYQGGGKMYHVKRHDEKMTMVEHPHVAECMKGHEKDMCDPPSPAKAREMLHHGTVHGKPLSKKQRGLFGIIASGKRPRKRM
jgi:hypothetical protein